MHCVLLSQEKSSCWKRDALGPWEVRGASPRPGVFWKSKPPKEAKLGEPGERYTKETILVTHFIHAFCAYA